jgi:hypothetical protein
MFRSLPAFGGDQRAVAEVVRGIMDGKTNNTGTLTLATGGATTTTLTDRRIGPDSVIVFVPASMPQGNTNFFGGPAVMPQQGGGNYSGVPEDIQKIQNYAAMGVRPITQTEDMRIFAQQLGGPSVMPQQGMRGFNQGPRTEADWKNFSAMTRFAPNTDMEKAKADFLVGSGGMPQQNMANPATQQGAPTSNPLPPAMTQIPAPTSSKIDPAIQPYLTYGLTEAQRLYQGGGPQYYGGETFVRPSLSTQTGLQALEARSSLGNPLLQSAQNQLQSTVSGNFLSGNPFFQGAFQPAAKAAESQFKSTLGDIASKSSLAGRYGSGAMGSLQDRATGAFSQSLANTAGQLAYQNYDAERGRQQAATMAAPAMSQADYQDIQQLLNAGQLREGYTGQQLQSDMARFNFLQNQPQVNLQNYLSSVYGNPTARVQQQAGTSPSSFQNLLGTAALLGGVEKNTGWLSSGWDKIFGTSS